MHGAMMKGYLKNNLPDKAIDIFTEIKEPNDIVINLLRIACSQSGTNEALNLINTASKNMPQSYYSNTCLITSLLNALMKCRDITHAQTIFDKSKEKLSSMYEVMIEGYIDNNLTQKAIDIFNKINSPDETITNITFNTSSPVGTNEELNLSKRISENTPKSCFPDDCLLNSVLDVFLKCSDLEDTQVIYDSSKEKMLPVYAVMMDLFNAEMKPSETLNLFDRMKADVNAFGLNGMSAKSIELYHQMSLESIDEMIYVGVLNVCSKSILVDEARSVFKNIQMKIKPIYATMVYEKDDFYL
ncbi:unnamed protein product [Rotaria magnacalcarata]|uniref:Pentatricopeptide repeat-containing protein n=1 Tax=Rotaria magnacalcarata TaxID=392030 RepID=A0A816V7J8_9BILA|nr:unnamed protein product [Rotaria magnacalcarata]CAF2123491.1 unnamed protein product [Rotaria magnacalcarata]